MKRIIFIFNILILLLVCTSCNKQSSINENSESSTEQSSISIKSAQSIESTSPTPTASPTSVPEQNDGLYPFYDEAVKNTVEIYFSKEAVELTPEDFASLAEMNYFVIDGSVESLKDIPNLFPNIKYLSAETMGTFLKDDLDIIESLESLKALSLYTAPLLDTDFAKNLLYLEITYLEDESEVNKNNLGSFSVLGQSIINDNFEQSIHKIVRIIDNNEIFELVCSDYYENEFDYTQNRKVFVSEIRNEEIALKSILDCTANIGQYISNRLYFVDVDFDGKNDILIDNGHFGNQGFVTFTCFLNENDQYNKCDSFSNIINPSIDITNKKILTSWRNWAASHSWAMYSYDGTQYIMTDCLTEEAITSAQSSSSDEETWGYTIEQLKDGTMQEIESFTTNDYTDEQIYEKIYDEKSYWGISGDKWETIFNSGTMYDFSIYGDDSINSTILDIIGS